MSTLRGKKTYFITTAKKAITLNKKIRTDKQMPSYYTKINAFYFVLIFFESQWSHNHRRAQSNRFSVKYRRQLKISLKRAKYQNFKFFAQRMKIVILTYTLNFSCMACRYFSKWRLKILSGGNQASVPAIFDDLPTPPEGVPNTPPP